MGGRASNATTTPTRNKCSDGAEHVHLRAPWRITFDTNPDLCNLSCTMCEEHSYYSPKRAARMEVRPSKRKAAQRTMPVQIIEQVIAESAGKGLREIIPSTMGEPLLYRDFPYILELCKKYGLKLNLTTNGTWPKLGATKWAWLLAPITSDVKLSWNGLSAEVQESIMLGTRFDRQVKGLDEFLRVRNAVEAESGHRCSVTLQLTFMEKNLEEIPKLVQFALDKGIDRIKGHHLWVHFPEMADQNLRRNRDSIARWNRTCHECVEMARGQPLRLDNFVEIDPDQGPADEILPNSECPFLGKEAWVNHSGRFDPCCAPDDGRKQLGHFGSVVEGGLLKIWNGEQYRSLVENYKSRPLCHSCNMRRVA